MGIVTDYGASVPKFYREKPWLKQRRRTRQALRHAAEQDTHPVPSPKCDNNLPAGLIGGTVTAILTGFLAVRNGVGHFAEDPGYLMGYAFAIFFLIVVPCFFAAVLADKISDGIHRVRYTSKE